MHAAAKTYTIICYFCKILGDLELEMPQETADNKLSAVIYNLIYNSCHLPVGLQDVNDTDEQKEALSFPAHSWNTAHTAHIPEHVFQ